MTHMQHMKSKVSVRGHVTITVRAARTRDGRWAGRHGRILSRQVRRNKIVDAGGGLLWDLLRNNATALTHFAVGTSTTAPAAGQTALLAEVFRGAITKFTKSGLVLTVIYFLPASAANGSTLAEAGTFTASSSGTMFSRAIYTGIAKTSSTTVTYSWAFTLLLN
jgi:hypothetical protein